MTREFLGFAAAVIAAAALASVRAKRGRGDRQEPDGSRHGPEGSRHEAPPCGRSGRRPAGRGPDRAGRPDATVFEALIASIPAIEQANGRRRKRPEKPHADKGYDVRRCRRHLARHGIACRIARKGVEDKARLGRHRWVIERSFAWLNHFRRLAIRHERREDRHQALLDLGCALICLRHLERAVQ